MFYTVSKYGRERRYLKGNIRSVEWGVNSELRGSSVLKNRCHWKNRKLKNSETHINIYRQPHSTSPQINPVLLYCGTYPPKEKL